MGGLHYWGSSLGGACIGVVPLKRVSFKKSFFVPMPSQPPSHGQPAAFRSKHQKVCTQINPNQSK